MSWQREDLISLEDNTNVLSFGILLGVFVVLHIAAFGSINSVIAAHGAILAGEPVRAALAEDDVAWDDILFCVFVSIIVSLKLEVLEGEGRTDLQTV
jgi:ABC-type uncharacterized transport system permease subunit